MWVTWERDGNVEEVPATYIADGDGLLTRLAPESRLPERSVVIAASGDDDGGSWRVVAVARVAGSADIAGAVHTRLVPVSLVGSRSSRDGSAHVRPGGNGSS